MKKSISTFQYDILQKELHYLEEVGGLNPNQANELLNYYEIGQSYPQKNNFSNHSLWDIDRRVNESQKKTGISLNFIQILSIIGAILIGLGVLSFVASNWSQLSDMGKFFLLLSGLVVSYLSAWWTEVKRPITSKALYYIGGFMYGAEIFYIGQMFHLGGEIENALFAWSIGLIPLAMYKKDKILYAIGFGLLYLSIEFKFMGLDEGIPSYWMFAILPLLFMVNRYFKVLNPYLQIANLVMLYQFVEMKFLFNDDLNFLWNLPVILALLLLGKFVFTKEKYLLVVNMAVLYQFLQVNVIMEYYESLTMLMVMTMVITVLFIVGHKYMNKSIPMFLANVIFGIECILLFLHSLGLEEGFWYFIVLFLVGFIFTHKPFHDYKFAMKWMGMTLQFFAGITLTVEPVYGRMTTIPLWTLFGLFYILYGLHRSYKNELFGVLIVSVLILRFYVDLSLAFMDKSIAFLVGGILLLGLGYWFEKTRRREKKYEEKTNSK